MARWRRAGLTLLTFDSFAGTGPGAIGRCDRDPDRQRIADEMAGSAVARNTFILLQQAIDRGGLPLTATCNLSRAVVTEMRELIKWPSYDQTDAFRLHKVINEPDFLPPHIVRLFAEAAKLVRTQRGQLVAMPFGKSMLPPSPPMRATSRSSFGGKTRPASANKAR